MTRRKPGRPSSIVLPVTLQFKLGELDRAKMRKAMQEMGIATESEFIRAAITAYVEVARQHWRDRVRQTTDEMQREEARRVANVAKAAQPNAFDRFFKLQKASPEAVARFENVPAAPVVPVVVPDPGFVSPPPVAYREPRDASGLSAADRVSLDAMTDAERETDAREADQERAVLAPLGLPWLDEAGNYCPELVEEQTDVPQTTEERRGDQQREGYA